MSIQVFALSTGVRGAFFSCSFQDDFYVNDFKALKVGFR